MQATARSTLGWLLLPCFLYAVIRYHIFKEVPWIHLPLYTNNKAISLAGIILLGYSLSLTAEQRQRRKVLGLLGYAYAAIHCLMSVCLLRPKTYPKFFTDGELNLTGELTLLTGIAAFFLYSLPAISSLPGMQQGVKSQRL